MRGAWTLVSGVSLLSRQEPFLCRADTSIERGNVKRVVFIFRRNSLMLVLLWKKECRRVNGRRAVCCLRLF